MATQRYISTSFWDDEWIQTLDPSEKLLYLYLMTNPLTNIAGVYKITIRRMCFDTGFNADTMNHILRKFEAAGKAYIHGEYIVLPSWPKHQKLEERTKVRTGIVAVLQEVPEDIIQFLYSVGYAFDLDSIASTIVGYKNRVGISGAKKKKLMDAVGNKCQLCGVKGKLVIHHKNPIAEGGDNSEANLLVICEECHHKIHDSPDTIKGFSQNPDTIKGIPNYSDSDSDIDSDLDSKKEAPQAAPTPSPSSSRFIPPTLAEVQAYCIERRNAVDPARFIDFYASKGWMVGKNKMKDWKAAIRSTWEKPRDGNQAQKPRVEKPMFDIREA